MFRTFHESDIRQRVPMSLAVTLMKEAFVLLSAGGAIVPARTLVETVNQEGRALFMPSYAPAFQLFGLKMVSVFDGNSQYDLPIIQGKVLVMDSRNGSPVALLDAAYLTALRTGAASGLATDLLAQKEAHVLALFGTGAQAITQVQGVLSVRNIEEVVVFGTSADRADQFCKLMANTLPASIRSATSRKDLKLADIICLATTSPIPVFDRSEIKPGVHINGIGSYKSAHREIPGTVIRDSKLVVDQREAALTEAGDIILPMQEGLISEDHIFAELGEIASGKKPGRIHEEEITVFKSVGNAIQDLAIAHHLVHL